MLKKYRVTVVLYFCRAVQSSSAEDEDRTQIGDPETQAPNKRETPIAAGLKPSQIQ